MPEAAADEVLERPLAVVQSARHVDVDLAGAILLVELRHAVQELTGVLERLVKRRHPRRVESGLRLGYQYAIIRPAVMAVNQHSRDTPPSTAS